MTIEERRREIAAARVAYMATELSVSVVMVRAQTERLEERLREAAARGVPRAEAEAMTGYGLDGIDVRRMIDRAYADEYEVTGGDTVVYCLAHRRKCTWLSAPAWWIHDKEGRPLDRLDGHLTDPRGCRGLWNEGAPITITRRSTP